MPTQTIRLVSITCLLLLAATALAISSLPDRTSPSKSYRMTALDNYRMYLADTDGWGRTPDESLITSLYDLRPTAALESFPMRLGEWEGINVAAPETDRLGLKDYTHVFRVYQKKDGRAIWLRLLGASDWKVFYHSPPICYESNQWTLSQRASYPVALDNGSLQLQAFVAGGPASHQVFYTFLWPDGFRNTTRGVTMLELVAPFENDPSSARRDLEDFVRLLFMGRPPVTTGALPPIQHRLDARLGEGIALLGYDLSADTVRPGETLRITLYWQALAVIPEDYTVFVHLLRPEDDPNPERVLAQDDRPPLGGYYPTSAWQPGEVVREVYNLQAPKEAIPGVTVVEVGMYRPDTGQRLEVTGAGGKPAGDRVLLNVINIGPR